MAIDAERRIARFVLKRGEIVFDGRSFTLRGVDV